MDQFRKIAGNIKLDIIRSENIREQTKDEFLLVLTMEPIERGNCRKIKETCCDTVKQNEREKYTRETHLQSSFISNFITPLYVRRLVQESGVLPKFTNKDTIFKIVRI